MNKPTAEKALSASTEVALIHCNLLYNKFGVFTEIKLFLKENFRFLLLVDADLLIKLLSFSESVSAVGSHRHQGVHDHLKLLCLLLRFV